MVKFTIVKSETWFFENLTYIKGVPLGDGLKKNQVLCWGYRDAYQGLSHYQKWYPFNLPKGYQKKW